MSAFEGKADCCGAECLLLAQSGHPSRAAECPLLTEERTSRFQGAMSAFDPKRTLAVRCGNDFEAGFGPIKVLA